MTVLERFFDLVIPCDTTHVDHRRRNQLALIVPSSASVDNQNRNTRPSSHEFNVSQPQGQDRAVASDSRVGPSGINSKPDREATAGPNNARRSQSKDMGGEYTTSTSPFGLTD